MKTSLAFGRTVCRPILTINKTVCGLVTIAVTISGVTLNQYLQSYEWHLTAAAMWWVTSYARLRKCPRETQAFTQREYAKLCRIAALVFLVLTAVSYTQR